MEKERRRHRQRHRCRDHPWH